MTSLTDETPNGLADVVPTMLTAALEYAARGWPVLPLHTPVSFGPKEGDGRARCSCRDATGEPCRSQGKHPRTGNGLKEATTNIDQIRDWWTQWPRANVGVRTGVLFDVIDLDSQTAIDTLESLGFELAAGGPIVSTGNGRHIYITPTGMGNRANIIPGLDLRGTGGYVVAPPSIHYGGGRYQWLTDANQAIPERADLAEFIRSTDKPPPPPPPRDTPRAPTDGVTRYAQVTLDRAIGRVEAAVEGERNHQLNASAYTLGRIVSAGELKQGDVEAELLTAAIAVGLGEKEAEATIASGLAAGLKDGPNPSHRDALAGPINVDDYLPSVPKAVTPSAAPEAGDGEPAPDPNRHRRRFLAEADLASIQPPEPLAQGWFNRNSFAVLFGPAKKGKTFVAIDLGMSVATGRGKWMCGPAETGRVVYCLGEGISGLNRRIQAWRTHHGITDPAELTVLPHVPQLHNGVDVTDFIEAVHAHTPDLIVIDTLARATVGVEENSSKDMGEVIAQIDRIKEATGACVLVLHHTGKDASRGTRGSSALTGAIDTGVEVRGDTVAMTLVVTHQKDGDMGEPCQFRAEPVGESIVMVPTLDLSRASSSTIAVMEALVEIDTGGTSTTVWKDMAAERGVPERTFFRAVKWLVDNREVRNVGSPRRPVYTVYSYGDDEVDA